MFHTLVAFHFLCAGITFISVTCRRIPLELIPEDEKECAEWLHKLYQEKVRVLNILMDA